MLGEIREGRVAAGLSAGIRDVGVVLADAFRFVAEEATNCPASADRGMTL